MPVADVVAVYRRMGSAFDFVTPEAVTHCLKFLYAGRAAVWSVGDAAVPHFSSHAAFMEQELHEFVYGGLEDMAMQTADAWAQLVQVLRGQQPIPPPFNPPSQPASSHAPRNSAAAPPPPPSWVHDLQPVLSAAAGVRIVAAARNSSQLQRAEALPPVIAEALADSREIYLEILNVIEREHGFAPLEKAGPLVWASGATFREQMGLSISSGSTIVAAVSTRSLVLWGAQGDFLHQIPLGGRSVAVAEVTGDDQRIMFATSAVNNAMPS